jgi:hypothetical protein
MVKNRKSKNQLEKERLADGERMGEFNSKKAEEELKKGMVVREEAMQKAGMNKQADNFADHAKIYNYADEREGPPIKTIDAYVGKPYKCHWCGGPCASAASDCTCIGSRMEFASPNNSEPDSAPPSPKCSRKRLSPCPSSFQFKPDPRARDAARYRRAVKLFEKNMTASRK